MGRRRKRRSQESPKPQGITGIKLGKNSRGTKSTGSRNTPGRNKNVGSRNASRRISLPSTSKTLSDYRVEVTRTHTGQGLLPRYERFVHLQSEESTASNGPATKKRAIEDCVSETSNIRWNRFSTEGASASSASQDHCRRTVHRCFSKTVVDANSEQPVYDDDEDDDEPLASPVYYRRQPDPKQRRRMNKSPVRSPTSNPLRVWSGFYQYCRETVEVSGKTSASAPPTPACNRSSVVSDSKGKRGTRKSVKWNIPQITSDWQVRMNQRFTDLTQDQKGFVEWP